MTSQVDDDLVLGFPDTSPSLRNMYFRLISPTGAKLDIATRRHLTSDSFEPYHPPHTLFAAGEMRKASFDLAQYYTFEILGEYTFYVEHRQATQSAPVTFIINR